MGKLEQEMQAMLRTDIVHTQSVKDFALRHARSNDAFTANFGALIEQLAAVSIQK